MHIYSPVVIFAANRGYALYSSRRTYIEAFLNSGYRVVLATSDDEYTQKLLVIGCELCEVRFERGGMNFFNDVRAFLSISRAIKKYHPVMVFSVHAKPVIFSNLALKLSRLEMCSSISIITGLGHAFIKGGWLRALAGVGYRLALSRGSCVIFQNTDDMTLFLDNDWVAESNARLIIGSGVDTTVFHPNESKVDSRDKRVLMLGRFIGQKGVREFLEVAAAISVDYPSTEFVWAGEEDPAHLDSVSLEIFEGVDNVTYLGRVDDVYSLISDADLLLFPSYREGVPRAIMECASMGLPCVGFDVPGVREVVVDSETGYLVPFADLDGLVDKVHLLLSSTDLREKLGKNARKLMKQKADKKVIESLYFKEFEYLGIKVLEQGVD